MLKYCVLLLSLLSLSGCYLGASQGYAYGHAIDGDFYRQKGYKHYFQHEAVSPNK